MFQIERSPLIICSCPALITKLWSFLCLCSYPVDHLVVIKISKEHQKPALKHASFSLYSSREKKIGKATGIFIC